MQKNTTHALADNVRRLMEHAGWAQRELATRAGISQRAVGYLINYKDGQDRHPTTQTVDAIAVAFGLQPWQLMMPNLPLELLQSHRFEKLIENYAATSDTGRATVERIAEGEVIRYSVAEAGNLTREQTGNGKH